MRRSIGALVFVVAGLSSSLIGCASQTVTMTKEENQARWERNLSLMSRQIGDDWDYFMLARSPSRLSIWHTR
ncbi:MAG: hypothetical protein SF069_07630 [Phycisphaerae bacterium]|nr:hypothetical protein [Phycisphaerae bacterium]